MSEHTHRPATSQVRIVRVLGWGFALALLLLPLVAMQFTEEVNWSPGDFVFAAILIGGVGVAMEVAVRLSSKREYHIASAIALLAAFLLVWINAAVGIIGAEQNPLNLLFGGVLVVGLVGALAGGFDARAMSRAMSMAAVAQALVALIAWHHGFMIVPITAVFMALWLLSAGLFRRAAADPFTKAAGR